VASARLKSSPDDFQVFERLFPGDEYSLQPSFSVESLAASNPAGGARLGDGEHLCVRLQKTGDNTEYVARELAALAGCRGSDVGFCGMKDRHAVTVQWFSLYRPGQISDDAALLAAIAERWPVLAARRELRKLRRGDHQGNGFVITLRAVNGERAAVERGLIRLRDQGAPNYFGPQRFGREGGNLQAAVSLDPSRLNRKRGRGGRSASKNVLYFSAARSWLFNEVLAERVLAGNWAEVLPGEPDTPSPQSPTGPLWGDGGTSAGEPLARRERDVVARHPEFEALFRATRMQPERRPLVTRPEGLDWHWLEPGESEPPGLQLTFSLPPGQYATTVLGDLFELDENAR
jgi:tRNA pseudouridine13 synthase